MAVRSRVFIASDRHPARRRSTLTRRMTSVSWAAWPDGRAAVVRGLGLTEVLRCGFGRAVRVGEGDADGDREADGSAHRGALAPGTPPPVPGARAPTARPSAGAPGPVRLDGSSAAASANAASRAAIMSPSVTEAGIGRRLRCRPVGLGARGPWSPVDSTRPYTYCLRGPHRSRGFDPGDGMQRRGRAPKQLRKHKAG